MIVLKQLLREPGKIQSRQENPIKTSTVKILQINLIELQIGSLIVQQKKVYSR